MKENACKKPTRLRTSIVNSRKSGDWEIEASTFAFERARETNLK